MHMTARRSGTQPPLATRFSRGLESAIPLGPDRLFPTGQLVGRGDPADSAVQPDVIVVMDVPLDKPIRKTCCESNTGIHRPLFSALLQTFLRTLFARQRL
jgi:hypothetical protein